MEMGVSALERPWTEAAMIRQAISCDICGAEKKQTNHWFVAYTHAGELRVAGWGVQGRVRAGSKHLCGQTCLHKLVDDFMARLSKRVPPAATDRPKAEKKSPHPAAGQTDTSLTSAAVHASSARPTPPVLDMHIDEYESSARLISPLGPEPVVETPIYDARTWRAEAWKREREREQRASLSARPSRHGSIA
jgi:hypothetical protein